MEYGNFNDSNGGISMQQSEAALTGKTNQSNLNQSSSAHFFMSANTASGFVSRFDCLYDKNGGWKAYILKGAPGIAAALLPDAAKKLENAGVAVEYIHCVSDPDGVSAVVLPKLKICVADGMPPHSILPQFPGVVEEEIMMSGIDADKLNVQRDCILQFAARASAQYERAYRFLSAAASLKSDTYRIALENVDSEAIEKYSAGLSKRIFVPHGENGCDIPRFLSGVTAGGVLCYSDIIIKNYSKVFIIEDEYGVGSLLLTALREKAIAAGHSVISCNCPMFSGINPEHLLIPSLSVAFLTSNRFHRIEGKTCRHINIKRFLDFDAMRLKKARVGFNRRASRELLNQAVILLAEAKADDDIVKSCYIPCVDFEAAKKTVDSLFEKIAQKAAFYSAFY
jgi:hypothetical protein